MNLSAVFNSKFSVYTTYSLGPVTVSCPRDESGGSMAVSRYCLLMFAVAL